MTAEEFARNLQPFLPPNTALPIAEEMVKHRVKFIVTNSRNSKLGDYRAPFNGQGHIITVNGDLNKYQFLVTTLHELAHLHTRVQHGPGVKPHGEEWKQAFARLLIPAIKAGVFPPDIQAALHRSVINAKASSCSDTKLMRVLMKYDEPKAHEAHLVLLESLSHGAVFQYNGNHFQKGEKRRTRFLCTEMKSKRQFAFHPLVKVEAV